jgi:hypothetical protein
MTGWSLPATTAAAGTVSFDADGNAVWFATPDGEVRTVRLYDGRETLVTSGFADVRGTTRSIDGLAVLVAEPAALLRVARAGATRADAEILLALNADIAAIAPDPETGNALLACADGSLRAVDASDGAATTITHALHDPLALCVGPEPGTVVVLENTTPQRRIRTIDVATGDLGPPIAVAPDAGGLVAAPGPDPAVVAVDLSSGTTAVVGLDGSPPVPGPDFGGPVAGIARWHSVLMALTPTAVVAREHGLPASQIELRMPLRPAWLSGYVEAWVALDAAGVARDDVEFVVDEGPDAGFVSAAVEPAGADGLHRVVVCAAREPGEFTLSCLRRADGERLAVGRFRVVAHWPDADAGPGVVRTGVQQVFAQGSWGGGGAGPQNIPVHPAPRVWRVLMVPLQLKGSTFTAAELDATRTTWPEVLHGPATPNVRAYYREASLFGGAAHGTDIELHRGAVLDPVTVDVAWADALESKGKPWTGWKPSLSFPDECATALSRMLGDRGEGEAVLKDCDAVVFLVRTESQGAVMVGTKLAPAKFMWPTARYGDFSWKTAFGAASERKPIVLMPDTLPSGMPAENRFGRVTALAHELGHTLGLPDLYNRGSFVAEVVPRVIKSLDLMGSDRPLGHFSLPNKLLLGWVKPAWVRSFDFAANPSGAAVTLQSLESLTAQGPTNGRLAGVEIRIKDGQSYYFEYRRQIDGRVGDQQLAAEEGGLQLILGTDVEQPDGKPDAPRPVILRLGVDADGNGPILRATGEDYEETDTTNIARLHDFRLRLTEFDAADPDSAHVAVEYVRAHRPELRIERAPGRGDWKSPDIDLVGPAGANRVVKGHWHRIVARVYNAGSKQADSVRVHFDWLPFTVSPGTWRSLGAASVQAVPPGKTVTFERHWRVPTSVKLDGVEVEHFCVKVSIDRYVDPLDPNRSEIVIYNNWAQSNFDTKGLTHGSPAERHWSGVALDNPAGAGATFEVLPDQDSPHVRSYVANAWLRLPPGGSACVPVATESLAGDNVAGAAFAAAFREGAFERPIRVSFNGFATPDDPDRCTTPSLVWGAGLALRPGLRTWIDKLHRDGEAIWGRVHASEDGVVGPVPGGHATVVVWFERAPDERVELAGRVEDGELRALIPGDLLARVTDDRLWGEAIFLGDLHYGLSRSGPQPLD